MENEGLILESDKNDSGEIIYYNIMQATTMEERNANVRSWRNLFVKYD